MYTYDYLLYKVQIFKEGIFGNKPFKNLIPEDQVWKGFLKQRGYKNTTVSAEQYYQLWVDLVNDPLDFARNLSQVKYENFV